MNTPKVISEVVENDLCIGCGICVSECPSNALSMSWNDYGFLSPEMTGICDSNGKCLDVCPFNPFPKKEVRTEDEIANLFLKESIKEHRKIGNYIGIYAGHSKEFRLTSSSGGLATYVLTQLLEKNIVDHVISVRESRQDSKHYTFCINSTKEELFETSETKYYPVSLADAFSEIEKLEGKVAVTGVACFVKAIRLAQYSNPVLDDKIEFIVGIICGGVKSRFFTEYLASKVGIEKKHIKKPKYRIKDEKSTAGDYSFGSIDERDGKEKTIKMRTVGDMWGTGLFKANACDFCDDVTTELSDISVGDAWLPPYNNDGRGANIIITRSTLADNIILEGIRNGDLHLDIMTINRLLESQSGSFRHRHDGLNFRKKLSKSDIPPKRFDQENISFTYKIVQILRSKTRRYSLKIWKTYRDVELFDKKLKPLLLLLKIATKINHFFRK